RGGLACGEPGFAERGLAVVTDGVIFGTATFDRAEHAFEPLGVDALAVRIENSGDSAHKMAPARWRPENLGRGEELSKARFVRIVEGGKLVGRPRRKTHEAQVWSAEVAGTIGRTGIFGGAQKHS